MQRFKSLSLEKRRTSFWMKGIRFMLKSEHKRDVVGVRNVLLFVKFQQINSSFIKLFTAKVQKGILHRHNIYMCVQHHHHEQFTVFNFPYTHGDGRWCCGWMSSLVFVWISWIFNFYSIELHFCSVSVLPSVVRLLVLFFKAFISMTSTFPR